ncbi:hypothetical protein [Corynebacterium pelargi]|uniref:Uncharacterized protein n=1 Tax=Corynebacterium pelargi TaxID=1471400 RepID=A0A410W7E0_9CORY|nr:hypothetical protein [Corynebacterium pelargi]QAU51767.1 hypothetical protein CPELA_02390 [Corynebacterium pelargi]GGG72624.1 hypothetical protein GCM10007338_07190 [Corynebacterium pelargi]
MLFFDHIPAPIAAFAEQWNAITFELMGRIDQLSAGLPEQWAQLLGMLPH